MSTIDEIKSKIDIVELVSEAGVKLRHAGRNYTGFCPFHDNKRTPAFVIWPETGTWRCFGACNEGGDIFKFVMKREGLDFKEALNKLAERAGVRVESFVAEKPEIKEAHEHLRTLLEDAIIYYRSHLFNNKDVLAYLREKRGLTDSTIETFGLGYAPNGWDNVLKHFTARGYSEQDLIDSGLLTVRESDQSTNSQSTVYDRFRNRIMIPIRDENGRISGFGARIMDPTDIPKFLNSPETPLFSKGRVLYGLDRARKPIRMADQAVIVEGYFDAIALHQAGYENVVSPMGTALTEDQLRLLKKFSRNIVLALDPDTAGQKAVLRGLEVARLAMSGSNAPVFDQGGEKTFDSPSLIRFASRLDANINVVALPDELDPDEVVKRDKDEWGKLISSAQPIILHVADMLIAERNINDPKVKAEIAREITPIIETIADPVERDTYRQTLARRLKIDERVLIPARFATQAQGLRVRRPRLVGQKQVQASSDAVVTVSSSQRVEAYIIGVLFRKPELLYRLDRSLQQNDLAGLSAQDFEYTDYQVLFGLIREAVEQDKTEHHEFVVDALPESLQVLSRELLAHVDKLDPVEEKVLEELNRGLIKMRRLMAKEKINQYRFLIEEAQQAGDTESVVKYQNEVSKLMQLLHFLDLALKKMSLKRLK